MKQHWRVNLQLIQSTCLTFPYTLVLTVPYMVHTGCRFDRFREREELRSMSLVETRSNTSSLHVKGTGFKTKYEWVFGSVRYEIGYRIFSILHYGLKAYNDHGNLTPYPQKNPSRRQLAIRGSHLRTQRCLTRFGGLASNCIYNHILCFLVANTQGLTTQWAPKKRSEYKDGNKDDPLVPSVLSIIITDFVSLFFRPNIWTLQLLFKNFAFTFYFLLQKY